MSPSLGHSAALRELPPDEMAPVLPWDDFRTYVFDYAQNQHVGAIGPTESGKSTLLYHILPERKYVTYFATKIKDETLDVFANRGGYERIPAWPPVRERWPRRPYTAEEMPRRLLWPRTGISEEITDHQRAVFRSAFEDIYYEGGWTCVWDEFWMMCTVLGLEREARIMLQQARSNNISFVMGTQRPARVPLELFDQTTHLFFWRDNDERNLKTIGGVSWLQAGPTRAFVANLEPHQMLYLHTRKGWMYRTTCPEI